MTDTAPGDVIIVDDPNPGLRTPGGDLILLAGLAMKTEVGDVTGMVCGAVECMVVAMEVWNGIVDVWSSEGLVTWVFVNDVGGCVRGVLGVDIIRLELVLG